jgi:hypothetical protein
MIKQKNHHWILLAKHLFGECSEDECKEYQKILIENPDFEAIANSLNIFWVTTIIENNEELLQESWDRHIQRMNEKGISFK